MGEETFPIRTGYGDTLHMTRAALRRALDGLVPRGFTYVLRHLCGENMYEEDFMAACRHFGLDHLLFNVTNEDVLGELRARRARGAGPSERELPMMMTEGAREDADAMLDAYEGRAADAEAMAERKAAMRGAAGTARRPPAGESAPRLDWPAAGAGEEAYQVAYGRRRPIMMTRGAARRVLGLVVPHGLAYMPYHLHELGVSAGKFESACRSLGLGHMLFDVTIREVLAELDARSARGAAPTARELPLMVSEDDRGYADAMLDVYERKAAEAEARKAQKVAPAAA